MGILLDSLKQTVTLMHIQRTQQSYSTMSIRVWACFLLVLVPFLVFSPVSQAQFLVENPRLPDQPDNPNERIRVTDVAVFGDESGPEEALLSAPFGIVSDSKGYVYILDMQQSVIKKFTADGRWIENLAGPGKAPGELSGPRGIVLAADSILVVQEDMRRNTSRFTTSGRFLDRTHMGLLDLGQPSLVGATPDGQIVYASSLSDRYALQIDVVNLDTETIEHSFEYEALSLGGAPEGMRIPAYVEVTEDGMIIVAHPFEYGYRMYSLEGKHLGDMRREFEGLMPPYVYEIQTARAVRYFSALYAPRSIGSGRWLGRANWPTNFSSGEEWFNMRDESGQFPAEESDTILDIFDADWNLIVSLSGEEQRALMPGRGIVAISSDGHIFQYQENGTIVKRRIEVLR